MFSSKSPIIIAQNAINAVAGVVGIFMLTRFFPVSWGMLAFGMGFVGLFTLVGDLGFSTAYVKNASAGEDISTLNSTYLLIKLVLSGVFVLLTLLSLLVWVVVLGHGFEYSIEFYVIIGLIPYYFFVNMLSFSQAYFTSRLSSARMSLPAIVEALMRNSFIIILVSLFLLGFLHLSINLMAIILPVTYGCTFGTYFAISFFLGRPWKFSKPSYKLFRKMLTIAVPLTLSAVMGTVSQNLDKVLIQFYWHNLDTGAFYLNQKLVSMLMNISMAVSVFFLPLMARASAPGDLSITERIRNYERIIFMFISPFVVAFIFLGQFVLNIFGGYYKPFALLLPLLSLNVLFVNSSMVYNSALISKNRAMSVGIVTLIAISINIVLDLILIPSEIFGFSGLSLGVVGAGVGTLASSMFANIVFRIMFYETGGVAIGARIPRLIIPLSVEAIFDILLLRVVQPYSFFVLAPALVATLGVFLLVALLVKEISVQELRTVMRNFNPLNFPKQLSKEIDDHD